MNKTRKINIILDLDQTLISSENLESENLESENLESENKRKLKSHKMGNNFNVFCRPHLQEFLDYIFKNFNVSVWTAASKDYAIFVIKNIILNKKPDRKLDFIFFSYHCGISKKYTKNTKNLKMLWDFYKLKDYNIDNTIILDDYKEDVYYPQENNCIIAKPFYFKEGNHQDDFLLKLIYYLKLFNSNKIDIKTINSSLFNIP